MTLARPDRSGRASVVTAVPASAGRGSEHLDLGEVGELASGEGARRAVRREVRGLVAQDVELHEVDAGVTGSRRNHVDQAAVVRRERARGGLGPRLAVRRGLDLVVTGGGA